MTMPANETTLYLVRHGQTEANLREIICGRCESPLTPLGREQAAALGEQLAEFRFDAAYTSTLSRAIDTAKAITDHHDGLVATQLPELCEQDYGDWEGEDYREIMRQNRDAFMKFRTDTMNAKAPGGETVAVFVERVRRAIWDVMLPAHPEGNILCVAHGGTIRMALCLLLDMDVSDHFYRFDVHNASLSVVKVGPVFGPRLVAMGLRPNGHWKW